MDRVTILAFPHGSSETMQVVGVIEESDSALRQAALRKAVDASLAISRRVGIELAARRGVAGIVLDREILRRLTSRGATLRVEAARRSSDEVPAMMPSLGTPSALAEGTVAALSVQQACER